MAKTVAIVQSNYIPWKGYFDLINAVDECVLLDEVQYTRRDWRNRNKIKTPQGFLWLSIPVQVKGHYSQKISDTRVSHPEWAKEHWRSIQHCYARAAYFADYKDCLEELYLGCTEQYLSQINYRFLSALCRMLGITTHLSFSSDYELRPGKTERLVGVCRQLRATTYVSGPAAQSYLDEERFAEAGMSVQWMDYTGYPEYRQLFPPFAHAVSIVDLILNEGPQARRYMQSFDPHS